MLIDKVQKKSHKIRFQQLHRPNTGCVTKMVESLKWEKLEERRKTNRLCMLYEIKNGLIDIDSHQYIQSSDSRTRGKDRLYQERTSSEAFGNSFFNKTIRDWNQLPANTTSANTVEGFRSVLTATRPAPTYIVLPVNSLKKAAVLPDTAQSFRRTLYIHV